MKLYDDEWLELLSRFTLYTDYEGVISLHCRECDRINKEMCATDLSRVATPNPDKEFKAMPTLRKINRAAIKHIKHGCLVEASSW